MGGVEEFHHDRNSLAAPMVFAIVVAFHFISKWIEKMKKRATISEKEIQLRAEIKKLLKEANSLSQPSTFAEAAKLRRLAAAKEKEILKYQESKGKDLKLAFDLYLKALFISKVLIYLLLIFWFWRTPVAIVSKLLVHPFGKMLSWSAGGIVNNNVMVGIVPWLIVSTRICNSAVYALDFH